VPEMMATVISASPRRSHQRQRRAGTRRACGHPRQCDEQFEQVRHTPSVGTLVRVRCEIAH
jgi:hypothetical protein